MLGASSFSQARALLLMIVMLLDGAGLTLTSGAGLTHKRVAVGHLSVVDMYRGDSIMGYGHGTVIFLMFSGLCSLFPTHALHVLALPTASAGRY